MGTSNKYDIHQILFQYFGYKSFRPLQEDIIRSVLEGKDTLALLPTGGGKSICYQVPAIAMEGLCLVVSPLIALMRDQVETLKGKGLESEAVFSGLSNYQIEKILDHAAYGSLKFLYLSPERLITSSFRDRLPFMKLNMIAVDEAHCISQWGYDFRPPYLRIAEIREFHPQTPIIALTATATKEVINDIQDKLLFKEKNVLSRSFDRPNLIYVVQNENNKARRLLKICNNLKGSGIIYVRNRRKTVEIAKFLVQNHYPAGVYHAGMNLTQRNNIQNRWMENRLRVMVATNAFGMGIDKPDVRFVVHMDIPDSPEAYFQEAGRAGRDGKLSYAILLYDEADITDINENFNNSWPSYGVIKNVYNALGNYYNLAIGSGKDSSFDFDLNEFCKRFNFKSLPTFNALKIIEKEGYIALNDAFDSPSQLMFRLSGDEMYNFQVANKKFDGFIKIISRLYGGALYTTYQKINEEAIAKYLNIKTDQVIQLLTELDKLEVISYVPRKNKPQLIFVTERLDASQFYLSPENYQLRKNAAKQRLEAMIDYIKDENHCRSQILLSYFGEKTKVRCGACDYCIKHHLLDLDEKEYITIEAELEKIIKDQPISLANVLKQLPSYLDEDKVMQVVDYLVENGKLLRDNYGMLSFRP
ncbi:MAG: ATP-dependent DNA helicase recq [Bacteroidetes bacterium 38_7]|nr:MAG: ATP-dependent DNA helicase recq [Bacteroidetes bacterium 38_7]HAL63960.1 RecQ family ATP-dependent DNA helicase [Bacteroidales bacterium]